MPDAVWDQINTPILYAVPFFALFLGMEILSLRHDAGDRRGYHVADTRTSISMGLVSLAFTALFKVLTLVLFVFLWSTLAPWHLPTGAWWYWPVLVLVVDLAYYTNHRFSHRVRIGWAAHQAHHSSEYFNLGTALRQKWNPWSEAIFWAPLPLLGFAPWTIYIAFSINLIYQFFTHTETVGRLWRPIEFVFNTPSHHRVHHGRDPEYLDKNYAGILIVWDRMFGTFAPERRTPTYGLTKPVGTYNLIHLQYHEYAAIVRDLRGATSWRERLGYLFAPPGWQPTPGGAPTTA
ncbi:sterol desaturase family protein [Nocardia sp. NPDC059177]|uniref:sterol desaturase family protein n=1 Tax=Nocardia sp. NPDC059177 TaxID=3346759 RepID=UPI00369DCFF9